MTVPNRHLDLINGELIIIINTRLCSQLLTQKFILLSWMREREREKETTRESNNLNHLLTMDHKHPSGGGSPAGGNNKLFGKV